MREVDRLMIDEYGITLLQMMENAGRNLGELAKKMLGGSVKGKKILVASGKGNNGGGGLAAARHLSNWGGEVIVFIPDDSLGEAPNHQLKTLRKLPVSVFEGAEGIKKIPITKSDLIIDSLIGYGLTGTPRGFSKTAIKNINALGGSVLSLDVPSGLDASTGKVYHPCIKADATLTLALPKVGLLNNEAKNMVVGDLYIADISVPPELYAQMGISIPQIFYKKTIIKV